MDIKEVENYCLTGYGVCVYRKRVKRAQFVIQNIIIVGGRDNKYSVQVEFDPMGMVDLSEGIRWESDGYPLNIIVDSIEEFSGLPIEEWQNFTKSGFEPFYSSESITSEHFQKSWEVLESKYENGILLLPKYLKFECKTIIK